MPYPTRPNCATRPRVHAAVVVFPGSNADAELIRTLRDVVQVRTSIVWHAERALPPDVDLVALPGGFSYGDYLRCGAIAKSSPILPAIRQHADRGGLVLGICNGFQILTECGLLPGALTQNAHLRFECRDVHLRVVEPGPFTSSLVGKTLRLPIAHAEGRYQPARTGHPVVALRYVDAAGQQTDASNPNGSVDAIAGIYGGAKRNILGLMPHPERMSEAIHGGEDGRKLFEEAVRSASAQASQAQVSQGGEA